VIHDERLATTDDDRRGNDNNDNGNNESNTENEKEDSNSNDDSDTMAVHTRLRQVVVDDHGHVCDIETAASDVGCHENIKLSGLELLERVLRSITREEAQSQQHTGQ
jgi:hypothetical protein